RYGATCNSVTRWWWSAGANAATQRCDEVVKELESKIEGRAVKWARNNGWRTRKMNGLGDRGWPDRLFLGPGVVAFIEFKKVGEEPTKKQWDNIMEIRKLGTEAEWFDNSDEAIAWLIS